MKPGRTRRRQGPTAWRRAKTALTPRRRRRSAPSAWAQAAAPCCLDPSAGNTEHSRGTAQLGATPLCARCTHKTARAQSRTRRCSRRAARRCGARSRLSFALGQLARASMRTTGVCGAADVSRRSLLLGRSPHGNFKHKAEGEYSVLAPVTVRQLIDHDLRGQHSAPWPGVSAGERTPQTRLNARSYSPRLLQVDCVKTTTADTSALTRVANPRSARAARS